ncbi:MAG: N-acetylmuramoyl-L-alanine amidase [Cyanobacteriota bacterium]|jgi:N-acetylmuramoyl-L-alanine amidase|nr:N-acetylmuramoyl-L-alanine amidase [Cyanobacteriota bacterium]
MVIWRWRGTARRWPNRTLAVLVGWFLLNAGPAWAASSLFAWQINRQGQLELRTTPGSTVRAYFEEGRRGQGPRVWFDLPGAPTRRRSVRGGGSLVEVRIGKPDPQTTRLVLEFTPGTKLDPRQLRLIGVSRDRWRMDLRGVSRRSLPQIGEGDIEAPPLLAGGRSSGSGRFSPSTITPVPTGRIPSARNLPGVPRGRYRVVIDPGHGGPDPGAVGIGGLRETDVVLDVGLQLAQLLQNRGVQVLLTRTSEVDVDLPPRVSLANRSGADLFVSLHANALSMDRPDVNGIETFYYQGGRAYELALSIQRQLMAVSPGTPDRGARPGRFFVIRRTVMPSVLTEMGFVTGAIDAPRLADARYRQQLAAALAAGILSYLGQ